MEHSAGDSESALIADSSIDTETITANWRDSSSGVSLRHQGFRLFDTAQTHRALFLD
jgi:hypothetical protein